MSMNAVNSGILIVTKRILVALMLREIRTLHGESKLGYLWSLIRTSFGIAIFWGIRSFMHAHAPHGMTILGFLCMGFMVFNIFSQTLLKCMLAIKANRNLLVYPQVYPLDIMLARCVVITSTQVVSMALILTIGHFAGFPLHISDMGQLLLALLLITTFGFGCGIVLSALNWFAPALETLVPMVVVRILFYASGVFYSASVFSHRVGDWLLLNPIMQIIEMAREAISNGYVSPYYDINYLLMVNLWVLAAGLLLERFIRRRLQA